MVQLISNLIQWALLFGAVGGLVDVTLAMRDKAAQVHATGLIRLTDLNRALTSPTHSKTKP